MTSVAALIPCYNEATVIGAVLCDLRAALPDATLYVYDNNSTDETLRVAKENGAVTRSEPLQGKGNVIRRMFADIDADVYVMIDGDGTYDTTHIAAMVEHLCANGLDLVNGKRVSTGTGAYRLGHRFGNRLLTAMVTSIFGRRIADMLSGGKVLSRRFVKSFPCLTTGFEIETEIAVHALELKMPMAELPISYSERADGSASKLHTIKDGLRIGWLILRLTRVERPLVFFGIIFLVLASLASLLGWQIFTEWQRTGLVLRMPSAVLCTGMMVVAFLSAACGMILETVTVGRREAKRIAYLRIPPPTTE